MLTAPIILFVFNRLDHTKHTVQSLLLNDMREESILCIYSDGPRSESDVEKVREVRSYVHSIRGFKEINIVERNENHGLARSIIHGVTEVVNQYGRAIVLEDDMESSPYFLKFMNEALELYNDEEQVINIHAYIHPLPANLPNTFFIKDTGCWGWATWKRGWQLFEPDGQKLLRELKRRRLLKAFDMNGSYYFSRMLKDQVDGKINSWAIRWQASAFLHDKLTLYPGRSLIRNIGLDGTGTHCDNINYFDVKLSPLPIPVNRIPIAVNSYAQRELEKFFQATMRRERIRMISKPIRNVLNWLSH